MAEVINLRQVRKSKKRADKDRQAAENRAKSGRTRTEKNHEKAEAERNQRHLDGAKLTREE